MADYKPTFTAATQNTYDLMKEPATTPEEKLSLQTDARDCEERWEALNDNIKSHVDRYWRRLFFLSDLLLHLPEFFGI